MLIEMDYLLGSNYTHIFFCFLANTNLLRYTRKCFTGKIFLRLLSFIISFTVCERVSHNRFEHRCENKPYFRFEFVVVVYGSKQFIRSEFITHSLRNSYTQTHTHNTYQNRMTQLRWLFSSPYIKLQSVLAPALLKHKSFVLFYSLSSSDYTCLLGCLLNCESHQVCCVYWTWISTPNSIFIDVFPPIYVYIFFFSSCRMQSNLLWKFGHDK